MKILHIADVHWRGLSRHQEYVLAFKDMFRQAKELEPDIIYVGGGNTSEMLKIWEKNRKL